MKWESAKLIKVPSFGNLELGFLNVIEDSNEWAFPFKRVYWTSNIPDEVTRGHHAHKEGRQILICLSGEIEVKTELPDGKEEHFLLNNPGDAILLEPHIWHTMTYRKSAIQLVLASLNYDESDYLRSKDAFYEYFNANN